MRFLFLPSLLFSIVWITLNINRVRGKQERAEKAFWEREREANMTRRKSLDGLDYITIPKDSLPMDSGAHDEIIKDCLDTINSLSEETIVNLTGYTNTDLKLMYGAPNINILTRYDQAYLMLARTLQRWGGRLLELGYKDESRAVLEFAISTRTDVSSTYILLKKMYIESGQEEKIDNLISVAKTLNSASKPTILRNLGVGTNII